MLLDHSHSRPEKTHGRPERSAFGAVLSEDDFRRLSGFIHSTCGIKMPPVKKTMLEGRLRKRLHHLGMESFHTYCDYLFSPEGTESECLHMIDMVTTNKTDFFREPAHFDCLLQRVLPGWLRQQGAGSSPPLNVWSAGCSTGEEAYTLAMVLSSFKEEYPGFRFSILATDISTRVLEKGKRGIYEEERAEPIPAAFRKKYLMRSKDRAKGLVRIVPELRSLVDFRRLNFMEDKFGISDSMAIIFCRNVMIYFDRATQEEVLKRFCRHLIPGGYLFTGHSETLQNLDVPLTPIAATVYRRM
jgi:chemotaxis protein methyltransferase CheR